MKKLLVIAGALAVAIVAAPAFMAFEAHVVNVTATIENALRVPTEHITFGTVFPQEHLNKPLDVYLSQSFLDEDRVDDVDYFIRQKPKCGITTLDGVTLVEGSTKTGHVVVGDDTTTPNVTEDYWVDCGEAPMAYDSNTHKYGMLPMLCPYISKHADGTPDNDGSLNSFHQPFTISGNAIVWNDTKGHLAKAQNDIVDNWTIDLAVPCFGGYCAQDWEDFVKRISGNPQIDPSLYVQPKENEHKVFGCDLWIEVGGISLPGLGCKGKVDLMLVVDRSGSIGSTNMDATKTALHSFIDALILAVDGPNAGQSSFASLGTLDQQLTSDPNLMHAAIDTLVSTGLTNLGEGINLAQGEFDSVRDRADAPNIMIILTDGQPNTGPDPIAAATASKADGTEIYVVGIGTGVNETYLRDNIASPEPPQHYFAAADFGTLQNTLLDLVACEDN